MFSPPPVQVRKQDLADLLAPAYQRLGEPQPELAEPDDGGTAPGK
jgi:hypothetical protein